MLTSRVAAAATAAALLGAGCTNGTPFAGGGSFWSQEISEPPLDADEVVAAVASLPECAGALAGGGRIVWRPVVTCGYGPPVSGCAYPGVQPPRIEIAYRASAWDGPASKPLASTLAHELCHVCGYIDGPDAELQADACAMRARALAGR